jgi:hypothetical protein
LASAYFTFAQKYPKSDTMRINTNFFPVLLTTLFLFPSAAQSQSAQRFKAGIIAGLTASQIDGDESAGYHKVGWQAGLRGAVILKPKQQASIEILYTQRGCRNEPETFPYFSTTLDYIEVPVQWHYSDWLAEAADDADNFYRIQLNVGLSYGRLLGYKDKYEDGFGIAAALPDLNENSFCAMLGATFFATRHLGVTFRWHRALNNLYNPGDGGNYASSLNEHFLAFQATYLF